MPWILLIYIPIWIAGNTLAWAFARKQIVRSWGHAPFNWRVFIWAGTYVNWIERNAC